MDGRQMKMASEQRR
ncbi:hypothetical protein RTO_31840 [[Ruminococcus] torques L2-14]|uniref:Uncharacterized protein n=1 Tax=[Ruminococcus] torques L2-14 TaxID=657313 RepID=D4M0K7_9FIRM|nr:hypothetical protein RTO_31840 [[Ruminococcus] torques L2-14]